MSLKQVVLGMVLAAAVAGCAHAPIAPIIAPNGASLTGQGQALAKPILTLDHIDVSDRLDALTPESVEAKARATATKWQADAELRFVGWGVAVLEFASETNHVFYSPSKNQIMVVTTVITQKWQRADVYENEYVAAPAKVLQPLTSDYHINAHRALGLAKNYFSFLGDHGISLTFLTRPVKLPFAFWGVVGDGTVVLVHANTGQSLSPRGFDPFPKEWTKKAL
ncbi:MAG: hypothetical protein JWM80_134 [Cyanobacteria bacterium RYN_339]|nr:hypothetical protein [Cyanobacteria bacterium RYN_339]